MTPEGVAERTLNDQIPDDERLNGYEMLLFARHHDFESWFSSLEALIQKSGRTRFQVLDRAISLATQIDEGAELVIDGNRVIFL